MKDYLSEINTLFPVRRSDEEKAKLYDYIRAELGEDRVNKETLEKKHNNIIIDDVSEARVVITAHYDTPAASLMPNFMMPANKVIGTLIHLCYPLALAIFSLLLAFGLGWIFNLGDTAPIFIYLVLYFGLYFCSTRLIANKNNKNDNTSGVATLLTIAGNISSEKVAFILFDNEEKGLLGSKAYNKKYKRLMADKLVINFDCVGNGDQIIFIAKELVEKLPEYELLKTAATPEGGFEVHHLPFKKSLGNSDHKSFPCSVGVMAASKGKFIKFITGRIHTPRDTVADSKNVHFLTERMTEFIDQI